MGRLELVVTAVAAVLEQMCNCKPDTYNLIGLTANASRSVVLPLNPIMTEMVQLKGNANRLGLDDWYCGYNRNVCDLVIRLINLDCPITGAILTPPVTHPGIRNGKERDLTEQMFSFWLCEPDLQSRLSNGEILICLRIGQSTEDAFKHGWSRLAASQRALSGFHELAKMGSEQIG